MKARKIAGERLVNYITDGITWKSHKDVILDFWVTNVCKTMGYDPVQFDGISRVIELPTEAQQRYEEWFNRYNFANTDDPNWVSFVDGTLNIFYQTFDPYEEDPKEWYIDMMQSEAEATEIVQTQVYHGVPNINSFCKVDTNSKPEEIGGRRNGYMHTRKLKDVEPAETKGFYWGVVFQCPETVSLGYNNGGKKDRKCINWAANAIHMTLVQIGADGRLRIIPIFSEGKGWKADRWIPDGQITRNALSPQALESYLNDNFATLYGVWDNIDAKVKGIREQSNARLTAMNVMNDEEIKVGKVISDPEEFIKEGNVPEKRRQYNEEIRKAVMKKMKLREREAKKAVRDIVKAEKRKQAAEHNKYHVTQVY